MIRWLLSLFHRPVTMATPPRVEAELKAERRLKELDQALYRPRELRDEEARRLHCKVKR